MVAFLERLTKCVRHLVPDAIVLQPEFYKRPQRPTGDQVRDHLAVVVGQLEAMPVKKKMIILQKEPAEHRDPGTSSPQGEPGTPPNVLTPHSPCTVERAVGVGELY